MTNLSWADWLMAPLSGEAHHVISSAVAWHGRLMVLGWTILIPLGVVIARYFKVTPNQDWPKTLDNKFWWYCHLYMQQFGLALSVVAVGLILLAPGESTRSILTAMHHVFGWTLLALGAVQFISGRLRGTKGGPTADVFNGDHYFMTPHRRLFERLHKSVGWIAVAMVVPVTVVGLVLADAPRWIPIVILTWWGGLAVTCAILQRRGMCLDTYQAIWGPDPALPGNQIVPIGWGISRRAGGGGAISDHNEASEH